VSDAAPLADLPSGSAAFRASRPSARYSLGGITTVLMILLGVEAASWFCAVALPVLAAIGEIAFFARVIVFVIWLYRARVNAEDRGWPQRRSPGWAIGAWFVPVVNLWYPFQIMADVWRAGLPPQARENRAVLPGIWWGSWLAMPVVAGASHAGVVRIGPLTFYADVWTVGKIALGLAAIITGLLVMKVARGPLGREA
jgi:hypothetical protein